MVIPSRKAISSVDKSEEKDGVGLKKEERHTFHFYFQRQNPERRKEVTLSVSTRLQRPAWLRREVKKANEQEGQLDWRKEEKL